MFSDKLLHVSRITIRCTVRHNKVNIIRLLFIYTSIIYLFTDLSKGTIFFVTPVSLNDLMSLRALNSFKGTIGFHTCHGLIFSKFYIYFE